jgi:predicted Zn-dependent protease
LPRAVRRVNRIRAIAALAAVGLAAGCATASTVESTELDRKREQELAVILANYHLLGDGETSRVERVVERLRSSRLEDARSWRVYVLDERWPGDAQCLPPNSLLVSARVARLEHEELLAFILAHEMAHCWNDDYLRLLRHDSVFQALGVFLGAFFGVDVGGAAADVVAPVGGAALSRRREAKADRLALTVITDACYSPTEILTELRQWWANRRERPGLWKRHQMGCARLRALGPAVAEEQRRAAMRPRKCSGEIPLLRP